MLTLQEPQDPKKTIEDPKGAVRSEQETMRSRLRKGNAQADPNRELTEGEKTYFALREKYHDAFSTLIQNQDALDNATLNYINARDNNQRSTPMLKSVAQAKAGTVSENWNNLVQKLKQDPEIEKLANTMNTSNESVALGVMETFKKLHPKSSLFFDSDTISQQREQFRKDADAKLGNAPSATPVDLSVGVLATLPPADKDTVTAFINRMDNAVQERIKEYKEWQPDDAERIDAIHEKARPVAMELAKKYATQFLEIDRKIEALHTSLQEYVDTKKKSASGGSADDAAGKLATDMSKTFILAQHKEVERDLKTLKTAISEDELSAQLSTIITDKDGQKMPQKGIGHVAEDLFEHHGSLVIRTLEKNKELRDAFVELKSDAAYRTIETTEISPPQTPKVPAKPEQGKGNDR
ncbi:MAG: hypothetical protein ACK502_03720 [Alphaproteobacteria bacterium]